MACASFQTKALSGGAPLSVACEVHFDMPAPFATAS